MTTSKSFAAQAKVRLVGCAGLVAVGLLAGCTPRSDVPAQPTTPSATAVPWLIDHLSSDEHGIKPYGSKYIAFCARADAYNPAHVPDDDDLVAVQITKADLTQLSPGDRCPADPEGKP